MANKKKGSIADSNHVMLTITGANRKQLKHFEDKLQKEMGVDDVIDIPNSTIINHVLNLAYRRDHAGRKN